MSITVFILRMAMAFLTGGLIGLERQWKQHNAGLRTNVLVAVGAAAFTALSSAMTVGSGDPSRVAAQVVTGIGFIGGGLILKDGFTVRGLNTAATIWCSAACGTLSAAGMYVEALVTVALVLACHILLRPLCSFMEKRIAGKSCYTVTAACGESDSERAGQMMIDLLSFDTDVKVGSISYKDEDDRVIVKCDIEARGDHKALLDLLVSRLRSLDNTDNVGWERRQGRQDDY